MICCLCLVGGLLVWVCLGLVLLVLELVVCVLDCWCLQVFGFLADGSMEFGVRSVIFGWVCVCLGVWYVWLFGVC